MDMEQFIGIGFFVIAFGYIVYTLKDLVKAMIGDMPNHKHTH